jgi:hypothetical protein
MTIDMIRAYVGELRARRDAGSLDATHLDHLDALLAGLCPPRQRLLYLFALSPYIGSEVVSAALHEPQPGSVAQIEPTDELLPYRTVHEAVVDGWHVVQFPDPRMPFDDDEIDLLGYQFVLQKLVQY